LAEDRVEREELTYEIGVIVKRKLHGYIGVSEFVKDVIGWYLKEVSKILLGG